MEKHFIQIIKRTLVAVLVAVLLFETTGVNHNAVYADEIVVNFEDVHIEMSEGPYVYTGYPIHPEVIVTIGTNVVSDGYSVVYTDEINVGTAKAKITLNGYKIMLEEEVMPSYFEKTFEIVPKSINNGDTEDLNKITINISDDVVYDGAVHDPEVVVKHITSGGERTLVNGSDYTTLVYRADTPYHENSSKVGEISVTIEGKGNYTGRIGKAFNITPRPIAVTPDSLEKEYGADDPELTYKVDVLAFSSDKINVSIAREEGEYPGTYAIKTSGEEIQGNYKVTFGEGSLTIKPYKIIDDFTTYEYTISKDSAAVIHCEGELDQFKNVYVDDMDTPVSITNYTLEEGSTVITFYKGYLDNLSVGTHEVKLEYNSCDVMTKLTVKKPSASVTPSFMPPKTGVE